MWPPQTTGPQEGTIVTPHFYFFYIITLRMICVLHLKGIKPSMLFAILHVLMTPVIYLGSLPLFQVSCFPFSYMHIPEHLQLGRNEGGRLQSEARPSPQLSSQHPNRFLLHMSMT